MLQFGTAAATSSVAATVSILVLIFDSCPVIATAFQNQLVEQKDVGNGIQSDKHHPLLLNLIAEELGVAAADISDFELCLADYQPAVRLLTNHWIYVCLLIT